jgi:hypothetical protein
VERVAREEFLRFALLIVLTIGLGSVAFRIDSHPARRSHAGPGGHPAPQVLPTAGTRSPGPTSRTGPAGVGTSAVADARPTLPVTGWDGAVKLLGCAFVLIGSGVSLRVIGSGQRG